MSKRLRRIVSAVAVVLAAAIAVRLATEWRGGEAWSPPGLADLCSGGLQAEYLEFYFDTLRSNQRELWNEVLARCAQCPGAEGCAPVASVAGWYEEWPTAQEEGSP